METWNLHYDTQHQVGAGRGDGDGAMRLTERQHRDWGIVGDETHRGHTQCTKFRPESDDEVDYFAFFQYLI